MNSQTQTDGGRRPLVALALPERDFGFGAAYRALFEQAGWEVRSLAEGERPSRDDALIVIEFQRAARDEELIRSLPARSVVLDLFHRPEYAAEPFGHPFHLLDNCQVIVHDYETRRLIKEKIRPVNCRVVMAPYPLAPAVSVDEGKPRAMYSPAAFRGHPWLDGLEVTFIEGDPPGEAPVESLVVFPEYRMEIWPLFSWAAAARTPLVAPGIETFLRPAFYGAALFAPGSEIDFRRKVALFDRPAPPRYGNGRALRAAVVVPHYQRHTVGGAENHAGGLAEALARAGHLVEIVTTRTDSMLTWSHNLPEGLDESGPVPVRRFALDGLNSAPHHSIGHQINTRMDVPFARQVEWLESGVRSSAMERWLRTNAEEFDALFFIPYLYGTTYFGAQQAPERSFLIPCYHREPPAFTQALNQSAQFMAGIFFNTLAEKKLAENELRIHNDFTRAPGEGIDLDARGDAGRFRAKYGINGDFILYVGRFQREKNLPQLLECFAAFEAAHPGRVTLAVAGRGDVAIPKSPGVRNLGFLPEQDKLDAMAACAALALPSTRESFSIVMMEAWLQGRPVMAAARCDAAREHIFTCGGGLLYDGPAEFERAALKILDDRPGADAMGGRGQKYAGENFSWERIVQRIVTSLAQTEPRPLTARLGDALAAAVRRTHAERASTWGGWLRDLEAAASEPTPSTGASLPALLDSVEDFADITTEYREFSHRAMLGGWWSRLRGAMTRHLRVNYLEILEGKQRRFNHQAARLLRSIYERLEGRGE
ncbi:MAG: glycosyltransferase family 4 protein [Nitrospinae bacterium]|nr:glycosyltransferase family 4 protein [Nitrospinota bacterium]